MLRIPVFSCTIPCMHIGMHVGMSIGTSIGIRASVCAYTCWSVMFCLWGSGFPAFTDHATKAVARGYFLPLPLLQPQYSSRVFLRGFASGRTTRPILTPQAEKRLNCHFSNAQPAARVRLSIITTNTHQACSFSTYAWLSRSTLTPYHCTYHSIDVMHNRSTIGNAVALT